jgi:aminoglycoside 3-N-acetyltransferase I
MTIRLARLGAADALLARRLFSLMAAIFEEACEDLGEPYLERLLSRPEFWAIAAFSEEDLVGGITAHTLPMTRAPSSELFVYDIAVRADHQRRGIGRQLVKYLRAEGAAQGIDDLFVCADDEDAHALDFYRALGGHASPVTVFSFERADSATERPR